MINTECRYYIKIKYVHAVNSMLLNKRIQFYKDLSNNIEDYH